MNFLPFIRSPKEFICKGQSKKIEEITDPAGEIEIKLDTKVRKLARDVGSLVVDSYYKIANAESLCRDIEFHLGKASECYLELSKVCHFMGDKFEYVNAQNSFTEFHKLAESYHAMFNAFHRQSEVLQEEARSFGRHIKQMFDFSLKELEGLEDVLSSHAAGHQARQLLERLQRRKSRPHSQEAKRLRLERPEEVGSRPGEAADNEARPHQR